MDAVAAVRATSFLDYRDYLQGIYAFVKSRDKGYTYIQYSSDLGLSKTNVAHLIIRGKRPLSARAASRVIQSLGLTGDERQFLELLAAYTNARIPSDREELFKKIVELKHKCLSDPVDRYQLEYYSEWYHPVIREMAYLPDFVPNVDWIVDHIRPRIRPAEARKSIQLLLSLGLLVEDPIEGKVVPSDSIITTGDEVASLAIVRFHQKMIELGRESITSVDEELRDIGSITVCVSSATAQQMKREVQLLRKKLLVMANEGSDGEGVYQLNIQLFPVTRGCE